MSLTTADFQQRLSKPCQAAAMIRMIQSLSAGQAKAYFSDALAKSDYYLSDQELAGLWQGKLSQRLGLSGLATKEGFFALCENRHPQTGEPLTPRTKEKRTTGYDINFHCPKSVSLLHILSTDGHILTAFEKSVKDTMAAIEADSKVRVRCGGVYDDRATGELAWAHFTHQTARPVETQAPDPHLHAHCFVFNATWDEKEQKIKACQFRGIKQDMPFYQAYFHKALSDRLMELGYSIRKTKKSFEIEGVPQPAITLFSKRTDEIGRIAKEKGITDAQSLDALGALTRSKKQKGATMAELKKEWKRQIHALVNQGKEGDENPIRFAPKAQGLSITPQECLDHALLHSFERASVMPERRLLERALRQAMGSPIASAGDILQHFKSDKRIIRITEKNRTLCTTKEVLAEEKRMVELARKGQGAMVPLYRDAPPLTLKGQQGAAVAHVLTTPHQISIIRGAAGSGKTTLMKEAVSLIEKTGKRVTVLAPTAEASRGVLRQEGFAQAETLAKFLTDQEMQAKIKNQVLWVDEAGLLGTKDMLSLLETVTQNNARLILGGDTRQHASVVRGDALRILSTVAGIRSAEVSTIYRQKNESYRQAVSELAQGNVAAAFEKLDSINAIRQVSPIDLHKTVVGDYIATLKAGKSALIISPTHAEGNAVTTTVREALRQEKLLGKKEITLRQWVNLNLTEAEKQDPGNFATGQRVQFSQNLKGFGRGSLWEVSKAENTSITVTSPSGEEKPLPLKRAKHYDVFQEKEISLAKGDRLRITRNGFDTNNKRLNNGDRLTVTAVSKKGNISLRNDISKTTYRLSKDFGHIAHAHCITSYAAQGKTVDEVFIAQPAATFPATDAKQFYVSVSRARDRARIYTDDKTALLQHAQEIRERQSALELVGEKNSHKDFVIQHLRKENPNPQLKTTPKTKEDHEPDV